MKKMLYLMHVPWGWIKQRPHFLAEELSKMFSLDIYAKKSFLKRNEITPKKGEIFNLYRIPGERYALIKFINSIIIGIQLKMRIGKYDIIWVPDPLMFYFIRDNIKNNQKIIFDCMDDYGSFSCFENRWMKKFYYKAEKSLVIRADNIICSSSYLSKKILKRYDVEKEKITIVNNAVNSVWLKDSSRMKKVVYIGTISYWLDFDIIRESLDTFENIEYDLYGPCDVDIPKIPRLNHKGILSHDDIIDVMKNADMLVMPFKVIPLVLSVNPVKLYEYILADVPAVAPRYAESEKFDNFVYLYSGYDDYIKILADMVDNKLKPKKDLHSVREFLDENTWSSRVKEIYEVIK